MPAKRPRKAEPTARETQIAVRLTDEERQAFTGAAREVGVPVSTWLRLLGRKAVGMGTPG